MSYLKISQILGNLEGVLNICKGVRRKHVTGFDREIPLFSENETLNFFIVIGCVKGTKSL